MVQDNREPQKFDLVSVTNQPSKPDDEMMTRNLLQSTLTGDRYQCPRCDFNTQNPEEMIHHLAFEINKSLSQVAALYEQPPPPKDRQK